MDRNYNGLIQFIMKVETLKSIERSGWVNRHVDEPESVADHTFGLSILILAICKFPLEDVDTLKCLEMSLVHDISECIVGDIAPHHNVSSDHKFQLEKEAMVQLVNVLGDAWPLELWSEYEQAKTPEAVLVHDLDKIEAVIQAFKYADFNKNDSLVTEFARSARKNLVSNLAKSMLDQLLAE